MSRINFNEYDQHLYISHIGFQQKKLNRWRATKYLVMN